MIILYHERDSLSHLSTHPYLYRIILWLYRQLWGRRASDEEEIRTSTCIGDPSISWTRRDSDRKKLQVSTFFSFQIDLENWKGPWETDEIKRSMMKLFCFMVTWRLAVVVGKGKECGKWKVRKFFYQSPEHGIVRVEYPNRRSQVDSRVSWAWCSVLHYVQIV